MAIFWGVYDWGLPRARLGMTCASRARVFSAMFRSPAVHGCPLQCGAGCQKPFACVIAIQGRCFRVLNGLCVHGQEPASGVAPRANLILLKPAPAGCNPNAPHGADTSSSGSVHAQLVFAPRLLVWRPSCPSEQAQAVGHYQQARSHVSEDRHPHGRGANDRHHQEDALDAQRQGDVLPENGVGALG